MPVPESPRPSSLLKRVLDAFSGSTLKPPAATPFREMGMSGTGVFGGYVQSRERSSQWVGAQRYVTISDMAVNASIVAAGVHYFLNLIAHPRWAYRPPEKFKDDAEAQAAADLVAEVMDDLGQPWSRVVRRAGTYRFYGFGVQEWTAKKRTDGKIGLASIEPRPQATIERWSVDESGAVSGVWQRPPQTGELLGIPRSKILYLVDDVLSDSPEGVGIFRHLAEPWERLKTYYALEARAFERDLRGTPVGRVPYTLLREAVASGELTEDQAKALTETMERFVKLQVKQSDTAITLDSIPYYSQASDGNKVAGVPQWGLELLQGGSAGMGEVAAAITRTQTEMARIIACEGLMMGEQSGNRALGEDKSRNLYLIGNAVLSDIVGGVRQDIISAICDLNGIPEEMRPVPEAEDIAFKSAETVARILAQMAQAGAVLAPDDPVVEDVRSLMGVSPPPPPSPEMMGVAAGPKEPAEGGTPPAGDLGDGGGGGVQKAFDPSQPRDDDGKWTDEGGGGGSPASDAEKEHRRATVLRWVKGALTIGLVASLAIPVAAATSGGVAAYSLGFVGARFAAGAAVEALVAHMGVSRVVALGMLSAITDGLIAARERELEKDPSLAKAADLILQRLRGAKAALAAYGEEVKKSNPNHDELGRFSSGPGGGGSGDGGSTALRDVIASTSKSLGFDAGRITVSSDDPPKFTLNGEVMRAAGLAHLDTGEITLYDRALNAETVTGIIAHEIMHQKYEKYLKDVEAERGKVMNDPGPAPNPEGRYWWQRRGGTDGIMAPDGTLREPYDAKYPLYNAHTQLVEMMWKKLAKDDGVTEYSKKWWAAATGDNPTANFKSAYHETLAEMARIHHDTGKVPGTRTWQAVYRVVNKNWKRKK